MEKSERFVELFKNHPKECTLEGITKEGFFVLMDYVYLDKMPDENATNENILEAALTFKLQKLVDHCLSALKRRIELENAVIFLIGTAKKLQQFKFNELLISFKSLVLTYIVDNLDAVKNADKCRWEDLTNYPDLLLEILIRTKNL